MGSTESRVNVDGVAAEVKTDPVVVYTKNHCMYCVKAKELLDGVRLPYKEISLDSLKEKMSNKEYLGHVNGLVYTTRQTSVPQIFICGRFIGGFTELDALKSAGHLLQAVEQCSGENSPKEE